MSFKVPNQFRVKDGAYKSPNKAPFGAFLIPMKTHTHPIRIIAHDGKSGEFTGWEHVSVSYSDRCPTWEEMCVIKDTFWGPEDCVVQFHPPQSEYVNNHPFVLHLWRPLEVNIPTPGKWMV